MNSMNIEGATLDLEAFSVNDAQRRMDEALQSVLKDDWRHIQHPVGHVSDAGGVCVLSGVGTDVRDSERAMFERRRARSAGHCTFCSGVGKLFLCVRCKSVRYCSKKCQTSHWREHKLFCHGVRT